MKKPTTESIDSFNAANGVVWNLKLFVKKVKKNITNPRKWFIFLFSLINRLFSKFDFLFTPARTALRNRLLEYPPSGVVVVDLLPQQTNNLDYEEAKKELIKINDEFIDWKSLVDKKSNHSNPKVSIIVLVLNNLGMTMRCIDSVMQSKTKTSFELIVVDNGSNSRTIKGLRRYKEKYPDMVLIHSTQNMNFALGNNIGFSHARGDAIVFLNNDTYVTKGWLDILVKSLFKKNIVAVQPALFYPDNTIQCVGVVFSDKSSLGYGIYANMSKRNKIAVKSRKLQAVTGACIAVRRSDFARMKGFDPVYINGQEDIDLCLRLTSDRPGSYCYCDVNSVVYHDEGKTKGRGKYVMHNRKTFLDKWSGVPKSDDEFIYRKDGYNVIGWNHDSQESVNKGLGIFIPVLKRRK